MRQRERSETVSLHFITSLRPLLLTWHQAWGSGELGTGSETYFTSSPPPPPPTPPLPPRYSVPVCRKMLKLCGETQERLAQELILFEFTIERDVIEPLYDLAEVNTPPGPLDCEQLFSGDPSHSLRVLRPPPTLQILHAR